MKTPVLFIACPRSGTRFISVLMSRACNLKIGHELMDADGVSDWHFADHSFNRRQFKTIFHQTRHPVDVINSLLTITQGSIDFMQQNVVPRFNGESSLLQCMKMWYYWNKEIESFAENRYRIEDIDEELPKICGIIGTKFDKEKAQSITKKINSRKSSPSYGKFTLKDLEREDGEMYDRIKQLAENYGYS